MQSTLIILISVLGSVTVQSDPKAICPKSNGNRFYDWIDPDDTVVLHDKNGDMCLTARFSIDVIIDEDGFVEDERKRLTEAFHVQTKNYRGICAGEVADLGGDNVTGPALLFTWNETRRMNQVLIHWEVVQGRTFLHEVGINLTVPGERKKNRYLSAKLSDLHLFPSEVGTPASVDSEELSIYFRDSSKGCLRFQSGDYTITAKYSSLSVVTVVVLALIFGIMMALGLMFYHRGSRKKQSNGLPT